MVHSAHVTMAAARAEAGAVRLPLQPLDMAVGRCRGRSGRRARRTGSAWRRATRRSGCGARWSGMRIAGTCVWMNRASSGPPDAQSADRPPAPDAGAHRPVAVTGHAARPAVDVEVDRRELGIDATGRARRGARRLAAVGDVSERLLEHEPDRGRTSGHVEPAAVEAGEQLVGRPELVGHAPVVGEVVHRAQRRSASRDRGRDDRCHVPASDTASEAGRPSHGRGRQTRAKRRIRAWRWWNSALIASSSQA